jgi:hypothetical protein
MLSAQKIKKECFVLFWFEKLRVLRVKLNSFKIIIIFFNPDELKNVSPSTFDLIHLEK